MLQVEAALGNYTSKKYPMEPSLDSK